MKTPAPDVTTTQRMPAPSASPTPSASDSQEVLVDATALDAWFVKNNRTAPEYEKSALRSKKFLGYIFADFAWKGLIALMVVTWESGWIGQNLILSTVICSTAVQVTYLLSQSWVDRSVRITEIKNNTREQ